MFRIEDREIRPHLEPGGIFLCGSNQQRSFESRYSVYRCENDKLVAREFAFSLDNVRPFTGTPFFSLHDGERETWMLAFLVGLLRSDDGFRSDYDARLDRLLKDSHILERGAEGWLETPVDPVPPGEFASAYEAVLTQVEAVGFVECAVSVLQALGINSWRNGAGHIAMEPESAAELIPMNAGGSATSLS